MEKYIYRTHETWGNDTYFFTEDSYDAFMDSMRSCIDGEVPEPDRFDLNDETGLYEGKYYRNSGSEKIKVVDWSGGSNIQVEYNQ